jgi:VWFA-related protein
MLCRALSALLALSLFAAERAAASRSAGESELSVRITSPLGRTGLTERIRIVAQVRHRPDAQLGPIRFFVDQTLLAEDSDGPPYAVEWTDENPFEPREIAVEVRAASAVARDVVKLEPMQISEAAQVSSVVMDVSVHDRRGVFVTGLTERDFSVREDGVPQTLDLARPVSRPATYTVLVDTSQSMSRRMDMVRHAASLLVGYLRPDDRIVLAPFSKTLGAVTGPTTDRQTVLQTIDTFRSSGGTAILDAVHAAGRALAVDDTRHAIVLLTDGYDEHSTTERDVALQRVRQLHATLYVIGIPGSAGISLKGETFLRDLANATGGRAFFPVREHELAWVEQRLTEEVQHQYVVSYTPLNQRVDGTWRTIALETSNSEWRVRTRPGYLAPAPPPIRPSIEFTLMNAEAELLEVSAENLTVREDGVEQQIDVFQESVDPVSIVLALDSSGSMKNAAEGARAAAGAFVAAVRPEDRLSLVTFADGVEFAHDLTKERSFSLQAIQQYVARGGTALYDALVESLVRLKKEKGRRVVVVVTDGRDENNPGTGPGSLRTRDDVLQSLQESEAIVFAIGLGPRVDGEILQQLAERSGGEAYFPLDVAELEVHYRRIIENLRRRYVISYTSTNPMRNGAWRTVRIDSRLPGTIARSQGGYFAPEN